MTRQGLEEEILESKEQIASEVPEIGASSSRPAYRNVVYYDSTDISDVSAGIPD